MSGCPKCNSDLLTVSHNKETGKYSSICEGCGYIYKETNLADMKKWLEKHCEIKGFGTVTNPEHGLVGSKGYGIVINPEDKK